MKKIKKLDDLALGKIFDEYKKLVIHVFQVDYICKFARNYRYKIAEKSQSYNIFNEITHVALQNFHLLLLWKLFDKKRSKMSVHGIYDVIQDQQFKIFFNTEIKKIKKEINLLDKWRNRIVCHRDITVHFNPKPFESSFKLHEKDMKKLKKFLFKFLCQFDFIFYPNRMEPAEKLYKKIFNEVEKHCFEKIKLSLKDVSNIYDSN